MSITSYSIASTNTNNPDDLAVKVGAAISDGWQPYGPPVVTNTLLYQVLIKGTPVGGGMGVQGPPGTDGTPGGPPGPIGATGPAGKDGQIRFTGHGAPPTVIVGASPGDTYLDLDAGDIYKLE